MQIILNIKGISGHITLKESHASNYEAHYLKNECANKAQCACVILNIKKKRFQFCKDSTGA